ncbi:MAG: glycosyltransferase [Silvibacterium sp.]
MTRKVCLVSLHFSPACLSLLPSWGRMFTALGYGVDYIVHPTFLDFEEFAANDSAIVSTTSGWDTSGQYEHALFAHPAIKNHLHARKLRAIGSKVWYIYHEPWESLGAYLRTEDLSMVLKLIAAHHLSSKMLRTSDGVILPSQRCVTAYERRDIRYNRTYFKVPLLFDDEAGGLPVEKRDYFSYIGNITKAHGFYDFIEFVKFALKGNLDIRFLIASRIPLPDSVTKDDVIAKADDRLVIRCGRPLTNEEINLCYARSICVWNVYRRSTQSGVLAKATMFGAPVLASEAGSFREFITDHQEGRLLPNADPHTIQQAFEDIRNNLSQYSSQSRQRFLDTFYYKSQLGLCRQVFLGIGGSTESI